MELSLKQSESKKGIRKLDCKDIFKETKLFVLLTKPRNKLLAPIVHMLSACFVEREEKT